MNPFSYEAVCEEILNGLPLEVSLDELEVSEELYQKLLSWNACNQDKTLENES